MSHPQIAGFEIERPLGRTGRGSTVYAARDLRRGGTVALRVVERVGEDPTAARELMAALSKRELLRHPGVLRVVDVGVAPAGAWVATPLVDAPTLAEVLERDGPLAPERALAILGPVASALDAAHALGLVCDSLTARSVLVVGEAGEDERGILVDVGPPWGAAGRPGRLLGDVDGLAPEEIRGDPPALRSNVYALGALLVCCLTGAPPFPVAPRAAVLSAHLGAEPPSIRARVPSLASQWDGLVAWALAKDPADRPASAGELIAAAWRILGSASWSPTAPAEPVALPPVAPLPAVPTPVRPRPRRAGPTRSHPVARRAVLGLPAAMFIAVGVGTALKIGWPSPQRVSRGAATGNRTPPRPTGSAALRPPGAPRARGPSGAVRIMASGGRRFVTIGADHLAPEPRRPLEAYAVWMFNSRRDAMRLGYVVPPVGRSGKFVRHAQLPARAGRYRQIVVTLEKSLSPLPTGQIVLEGALPALALSRTRSAR